MTCVISAWGLAEFRGIGNPMTMFSYAHNFEDVILFRALKDIEKGFYIDVGAQDPTDFSVTKVFYERGWRGINVEPVPYWFEKLVKDRPEDINLQVAASYKEGAATFFEVVNTPLSTFNFKYAQQYKEQGLEVKEYEVSTKRLDTICREFSVNVIHFLKIDVEGEETSVLKGIDLSNIRPWIILIEANDPLSRISNHEQWENLLTESNYSFVYYDGVNRFYLSQEHLSLRDSLAIPPNNYDNFICYGHWKNRQFNHQLEMKLNEALIYEQNLQAELSAVYSSNSWHFTAPLRWIKNFWLRMAKRYKDFLLHFTQMV